MVKLNAGGLVVLLQDIVVSLHGVDGPQFHILALKLDGYPHFDAGIPSTSRQFRTFARIIERDKAAVLAGLRLPYSTGPVEGYINRLKLIKREAYGRARLSYLQHRFLPAA